MAPHRYGKTSLTLQVIKESKLPMAMMEFTLVSDHCSAQNIISDSLGKLMMSLMPSHKKVLALAAKEGTFRILDPAIEFYIKDKSAAIVD